MKLKIVNTLAYSFLSICITYALYYALRPYMSTLMQGNLWGGGIGGVMIMVGFGSLWKQRFSDLNWALGTIVKVLLPAIFIGFGTMIVLLNIHVS